MYERRQLYGHNFKAWIAYQRVALRLPYESIVDTAEEYFGERVSLEFIPDSIQELGCLKTPSRGHF
jgi:hypothetical protein